jgi:myosin-9
LVVYQAPCQFDDEIVLRQLRYTGMLATVKIRQAGYNYRLLFEASFSFSVFLHSCKKKVNKKIKIKKSNNKL